MRLSISSKIFIAFLLMLVTFGAVLTFQVVQMRSIYNEVELINAGYVPLSLALNDIRSDLRSYNVVLGERDWQVLKKTLVASRSLYNFPEQLDIKLQRTEEHIVAQLTGPLREGERKFLDDLLVDVRETRQINASFRALSDRFADAVVAGQTEDAEALQNELRRMERRLATRIRASQRAVREQIDRALLRAQQTENSAFGAAVGLSFVALLVSAGIMLVIQLTIRPLRLLTEGAKRIASGDYRPVDAVETRDEIGVLAGEFNHMVRTIADRDTALREQAEELERANQRLSMLRNFNEDILNSVKATIVAVGRDGQVTAANRAALRRFGQGEELIGRSAAQILPLAAIERGAEELQNVIERSVLYSHDAVAIEHQGETFLFDVTLLPFKAGDADDGQIQGVLVVGDDVTDRVRTKEALIKSERLAAIGEIATKVTHELRNPLSTIRLNAEMMTEDLEAHGVPADTDVQGTLRAIISEVERLGALTEDYLRFARLPDPNPVVGDLNELLESIVDFQRDDLEWAGIDVVVELAEGLPRTPIDANQLRRAMLNLIRNAREAMEQTATRTLTIRTFESTATWPLDGADRTLAVEIVDTGCGMSQDEVGHVFEPFFSMKEKGTGLGLPLTLQIVEEHGGKLICSSEPDVGTRFVIVLPGARAEATT